MERLRKSFRRNKNKGRKEVEEEEEESNAFETESVLNVTCENSTTEFKDPTNLTRMQKIRNSMRIKRKKNKGEHFENGKDEVEMGVEPKLDDDPFEKTSKFRSTFRLKKSKKKEEESDEKKEDKKTKKKKKSSKSKWEIDEEQVRSNKCEYKVKYLGNIEVMESRGMEVCESAIKTMKQRAWKTKTGKTSATLQVSGDGLRVIEKDTNGMLVDQVIEKVSFCAPDRNYSRGFAYISRDGASRRWVCHGFLAKRDTGERLSHAVGVAFAVCLERKQARECEGVTGNYDENEGTFTRFGSFKQGTLTERLRDPQEFKESVPKPLLTQGTKEDKEENPFAISRPKVGDPGLRSSMRGVVPGEIKGLSPFKRGTDSYSSVRVNELPSNVARREKSRVSLILEETFENEETKNEINSIILQMTEQARLNTSAPVDLVPTPEFQEPAPLLTPGHTIPAPLLAPGRTAPAPLLAPGPNAPAPIAPGPTAAAVFPAPAPAVQLSSGPTPPFPSSPTHSASTPINNAINVAIVQTMNNNDTSFKVPESLDPVNPWDLVPDQPKIKQHTRNNSANHGQNNNNAADQWLASLTSNISDVNLTNNELNIVDNANKFGEPEDPLDTEWVALAKRNNMTVKEVVSINNTNPFKAFV